MNQILSLQDVLQVKSASAGGNCTETFRKPLFGSSSAKELSVFADRHRFRPAGGKIEKQREPSSFTYFILFEAIHRDINRPLFWEKPTVRRLPLDFHWCVIYIYSSVCNPTRLEARRPSSSHGTGGRPTHARCWRVATRITTYNATRARILCAASLCLWVWVCTGVHVRAPQRAAPSLQLGAVLRLRT